jgi:transposase
VPIVSCYEAGRDGFWLHRYLVHCDVANVVVDASSIEVNRRARRAKTDRVDVEQLLRLLIRYHHGEKRVWSVVHVPSVEEEDARRLHRELERLKKERTGHRNRIQALLVSQGVRLQPRHDLLGACPRINVYGPLIPRQPYGEGVWMGTPAVSTSTVVRHNWFTDGMTPCQEVLAVYMAP